MAKTFEISTSNSVRYIHEKTYNPELYYSRHIDDFLQKDLFKSYQNPIPYSQKFTLEDQPTIQILSDYTSITASLYSCGTNIKISDFVITIVANDITGETYKCYEFDLFFLTEGNYYSKIIYINDDLESIEYISEPICIKNVHIGTLLFEYSNSYNSQGMVFEKGYEGTFRIEADLIEFNPDSIDTIYNDQIHDPKLVYSIPFRDWTLAIGGVFVGQSTVPGVPDYMIEKINRILSCDQVKIDGRYYCKKEGAKWEEIRIDRYPFTGRKILISESENKFVTNFDTSFLNEDMAYNYRVIPYLNQSSNVMISNIFKDNTSLEKICFKYVGAPFSVTVATTTTGNDDDFSYTKVITKRSTTLDIQQFFTTNKTIVITGLDDSNLVNMFVCWLRLDAPKSGTSNPYYNLGVGAIVHYKEQNVGDFDLNFDDGLGRDETAWVGWAVCDGRRGTDDWNSGDYFMLPCSGLDITRPAGGAGGSQFSKLTLQMLPRIWFRIFGDSKFQPGSNTNNNNNLEPYVRLSDDTQTVASMGGQTGFDQMRMSKSAATEPTIGRTNTLGGINGDGTGDPDDDVPNVPITPKFRRVITLQKISE